jgi:uncharacterized protein YkwD
VGGYYVTHAFTQGSAGNGNDGAPLAAAKKDTGKTDQPANLPAKGRQDTPAVPTAKADVTPKDQAPKEAPTDMPKEPPPMPDPVVAKLPDPMPQPKTMPEPKPEPPPEPKAPPQPKLSPEEEQILLLVNTARANDAKKLPPLRPNALLFDIARAQAARLAKQENVDATLDEKKLGTMLTAGGYKFTARKLGANQAADKDLQPSAAFQAWFDNNVTKDVLLEPNEETGIGIGKSDKGELFYLMIYATSDK